MSNGRILIVEDDEDLACMLEYNLSRKGYVTMTALDGLAACRLIEEKKPDLILLDIMLPGMDGWQICRIIRNHEREDISEVENAIKYSPKGSDVTICVRAKSGVGTTVEVADRGPGIPAGDRVKIFDKFYRGENVKARTKGTGLGLYISKTLIESMGGAIHLKSNHANGTCFTIRFNLPSAFSLQEEVRTIGCESANGCLS